MLLLGNQMVKKGDGSMVKLEDLGGGSSDLEGRVETLETAVADIQGDIEDLDGDVSGLTTSVGNLEVSVSGLTTSVNGIENYLNSPSYSEQVLCYADEAPAHTKVTEPGRIAYVYEIDKTLGKRVLSSNIFFVKNGYIGNGDVYIKMTKGTVLASLYGNPDGKFVFSVTSSDEPENSNIVYLCGTIARI